MEVYPTHCILCGKKLTKVAKDLYYDKCLKHGQEDDRNFFERKEIVRSFNEKLDKEQED